MTAAVAIPRGGRNAEERIAAEKASRKNRSFSTDWDYLKLAPPAEGSTSLEGESKVIRLVTDEPDWRETRQHGFISTKPKPSDYPEGKSWPVKMGAVCRRSPGFDKIYDDCYICGAPQYQKDDKNGKPRPPYAGPRLWAVAVEREPLIGTQAMADAGEIQPFEVGSSVGYQDVTIEKDEYVNGEATGNKIKMKKFLVLNFGLDNFFNALLGFQGGYGTVVDRDYKVTRKGSGTDTEYSIVPLDKTQVEVNGKLVNFDLRNPDIAKDYELPFDLDAIIANLASDEFYEWFFDTRVESSYAARFPNAGKEDGDTPASKAENQAAQTETTKATIDKMRARFADKQ